MDYTKDGGARASTLAKYQTIMDQLQAFADWKGLRYLQLTFRINIKAIQVAPGFSLGYIDSRTTS